jgi:hypothetical protein
LPVAAACLLQRNFVAPPAPPSRCRRLARLYLMNHVVSKDAPVIEFDAGGVPLYAASIPRSERRISDVYQ